jgi:molecular chaperone GrpE (heat shock protein)
MSDPDHVEEEFAAAMQQLSAEAEKALPAGPKAEIYSLPSASESELVQKFDALSEQVQGLENILLSRLEQIAADIESSSGSASVEHFQKIEEQLTVIRGSESVNQKLFDSLHAELLKYRDNFLHESLQKPFIHDLVHLYDHLTSLWEQLRGAAEEKGKRGNIAQWRDNLENAIHSLVEILHRFEVKEIEPREVFDRTYHRAISYEPADFPEEDGRIVMRVRRGFIWRGKLIRPEEVIVRRYG